MKYRDYIRKLSKKILTRLDYIESIHNFENGNEFEVAICQLLVDILPQKYGVCRGSIVNENNDTVGDDVIIYDRIGYPTLRSSIGRDFSLLEEIPVESVYAYIECKHKLYKETTLKKGIEQVEAAKQLILKREKVIYEDYAKQREIFHLEDNHPVRYPKLKNQPFGVLFSRYVEEDLDEKYLNGLSIFDGEFAPDLIIAGNNLIMTPTAKLETDSYKSSLFHNIDNSTPLLAERLNETGFGVGIVTLMFALEWIQLNPINWTNLLDEPFSELN